MDTNPNNTVDNSSAIFGTSSDAIIEGLHNGSFTEPTDAAVNSENPGDKDQIVNEQDQNTIVNPIGNDAIEEDQSFEIPPALADTSDTKEKESDIAEDDLLEEGFAKDDDSEIDTPARKSAADEDRTQKNLPKM